MNVHEHTPATPGTASNVQPHERFLKINEVARTVGDVSKPTVYKLMREQGFPKPYRLLPNRIAWSLHEVLQWIEARKAEQQQAE